MLYDSELFWRGNVFKRCRNNRFEELKKFWVVWIWKHQDTINSKKCFNLIKRCFSTNEKKNDFEKFYLKKPSRPLFNEKVCNTLMPPSSLSHVDVFNLLLKKIKRINWGCIKIFLFNLLEEFINYLMGFEPPHATFLQFLF